MSGTAMNDKPKVQVGDDLSQDLAAFTAAWKRAEGENSSAEQILVFEKQKTLLRYEDAPDEQ